MRRNNYEELLGWTIFTIVTTLVVLLLIAYQDIDTVKKDYNQCVKEMNEFIIRSKPVQKLN